MSKIVVISLGQSDLGTGFPYVTAQIWLEEVSRPIKLNGRLPSAREIMVLYQQWKEIYSVFYERVGLRRSQIRIEQEDITNFSEEEFNRLCIDLERRVNDWFESSDFRNIDRQLRSYLDLSEEIEIIIESDDDALRRIPWHLWSLLSDYRQAEISLSSTSYQRIEKLVPNISRTKIRILAILGDSSGIDVEADRRFLETLKDAETIFLVEPKRQELDQWLWDEQGWDILFFAGHSHTDVEVGRMHINKSDSLTISQISNALNGAIERGLQLAIFNSCDGLGIARQLSNLHVPQLIVMREPVPDRVAQEFLKAFLINFTRGKSLYVSVREARERLQGLENDFPCASWLPVTCHNPAEELLSWNELLERRLAQSKSPTRPYQGLFAFREEDAPLFFGREAYIEQLVVAVQQKSLVAAVGPSGSGKSSVVFAGLIPKMREKGQWTIFHCRPTDRPFQSLSEELVTLLDPEIGRTERILRIRQLANGLKNKELTLIDILRDILLILPDQNLLLVIDQFEELYTLCRDIKERQVFLDQLLAAISENLPFTIVLTLRADFYGQVLSSRPFSDALQGSDVKLGPMNLQELQDVIVKPAESFGVQLEPGLTRRIVDEVIEEPGSLPLLEFALTQLWDKRNNDWMTHSAYTEIGGVKTALARYADEVYGQLSSQDQLRTQRIFIQLVRPGEGTEDTRRIATRVDIGEDNWDLVRRLADARLVVTGRAEQSTQEPLENNQTVKIESEETVEVIHEALIREWESLRNWMNASRDFRSWQERLKFELRQWESTGRDQGALLRGAPLATAADWMQKRHSELNSLEQKYIQQSLDTQQREKIERERLQAERLRLQKKAILGLAGGLAISLLLAGVTGWQWVRAESQRRQAQLNELQALAASSEASFQSDQRFEALLGALRAAIQLKESSQVNEDIESEVTTRLQQALYAVRERNRLEGHDNRVNNVEVSPDGEVIASVGADGVISLWNQDGSFIRSYQSHDGSVISLAFNPNNNDEFVTVGDDGAIRLWNVSQNEPIEQWADGEEYSGIGVRLGNRFDNEDGSVFTLIVTEVFSNSPAQKAGIKAGDLILQVNGQSTEGIIQEQATDIIENKIKGKTGTKVELLIAREGEGETNITVTRNSVQTNFNDVEFSPDGEIIATTGATGLKLWRRSGEALSAFESLQENIKDLDFSPDGKLIAMTSTDNTVKLWRLDGTLVKSLNIGSQVLAVNFDPSGSAIVTADVNGYIQVWYRRGEKYKQFWHSQSAVQDAKFSPDGSTIVSVSGDKTIKIWSWNGTLLDTFQGHKNWISSVDFAPDGRFIVTGSHDRTIRIWNLSNPLVSYLEGHTGYVNDVTFSPDGQKIASVGGDNTLKLWSSDGILEKSWNSKNTIYSVDFSSDGKVLASSGTVPGVKLWSTESVQEDLDININHKDHIFSTAFSPDGNRIATSSRDSTVKLWDRSGQLLQTLKDPSNVGYFAIDATFSPDGKILAVARGELAVEIWDLDGNLISILEDHVNSVFKINFSPDGNMIGTASLDGTAKIWSANGQLLSTLQGHEGSVFDIKFGINNKDIFTSGEDATIRRWDLDGNLLGTFQGHNNSVQSIDISPDGKTLVSAGGDGKIILWDLQTSLNEMVQGTCYLIGDFLEQNSNVSKSDRQLCNGVSQYWVAEGAEQASLGNLDEAVSLLETAKQKLNMEFDPEIKARQIRANFLLSEGERLVIQGKVRDAVDVFEEVEEIAPNFQITADSWLLLCKQGSLYDYARDVLFACENAVELGETGYYRDGLGLAMMLSGRADEAIEEFQSFVDYWDEVKELSPDQESFNFGTIQSQRRQRWIQTLKAGELVTSDEIDLLWREGV